MCKFFWTFFISPKLIFKKSRTDLFFQKKCHNFSNLISYGNILTKSESARIARFCLNRQRKGIHGRPHKDDDSCYTFWTCAALKLANPKIKLADQVDVEKVLDFGRGHKYIFCLNPHAPDRFTPSRARCTEKCGSALTHR